jgi:hypothetical protein
MTGGAHAAPAKFDPGEVVDDSVQAHKPDVGKSGVKADPPKTVATRRADAAKTAKAHAPAKLSARTNALKAKGAKKKHPDPKHVVKKTAKPKAKPHPSTTAQ